MADGFGDFSFDFSGGEPSWNMPSVQTPETFDFSGGEPSWNMPQATQTPNFTGGGPGFGASRASAPAPTVPPTDVLPGVDAPAPKPKPGVFDTIKGIAKDVLPVAQLGVTGMGIASGIQAGRQASQQNKILGRSEANVERAQAGLEKAAAPGIAAATALMPAGTNAMLGAPLPPNLEMQAVAFENDARAKMRDFYARAGIPESTMETEAEIWIKEQAAMYRNQLAAGLLTAGTAAESGAVGALGMSGKLDTEIANAAASGHNSAALAMQNANRALTSLVASSPDDKKKLAEAD